MSKIFAVFGATGHQGSSIINYVLNDPELSQSYKIRAITRDVTSEKVEKLKGKVEIVYGDAGDRASLKTALTGVHTVFAMTTPSFGPDSLQIEFNIGKGIADVAVEKGVEYIIWSTLPAVTEISGGKYTAVTPFDAKAKVEQYIRGLPIKSAFYAGGWFMENLKEQVFLAPKEDPAVPGTWVLARPNSAKTLYPYVDAVGDTGKFIGAILAEPEKFEEKKFCGAERLYSQEEIAAILSKATGKNVVHRQIPLEDFKKTLPFAADLFADAFLYQEEYGYFGPETKTLVAWSAENARGKLRSLEEYLVAHPLQLE